tara:strand:+ start:94248 stop:95909 length:1662 start_codon:yes stop_codon:yes gene_type:complete
MGFNNSATTTTLQVHLTDYGRRLLFQGSLGDTIKTFTLGDSDRDYRNVKDLGNGFVPDVTGDYEGVSSLNSGFKIKHKLCYTGKQGNIQNYSAYKDQVFFGFKNDNGDFDYYDTPTVTLYLSDYQILLKALSHDNISYHNYSGQTSAFTNYFNTIQLNDGLPVANKMDQFYYNLESAGRGLFLDFYDCISVSCGGNYEYHNIKLVPASEKDLELFKRISGGVYLESDNSTTSKAKFKGGTTVGIRARKKTLSPYSISMASKETEKGVYQGAGPGGIGYTLPDYGYVIGDVQNPSEEYYLTYNFTETYGGFYHPAQIESKSYLTEAQNMELDSIVPASRLFSNNVNTNFYYPLLKKQVEVDVVGNRYKGSQGTTLVGTTTTKSNSALESFIDFATAAEYTVSQNVKSNNLTTLSLNSPTRGGVPLMLERLYSNTDDFWLALSQDNVMSSNVSYVGTKALYTADTEINFFAYSLDKPSASPASIKVKLVIDKKSIRQSVAYAASTPADQARWELYNKNEVRFYGEAYDGLTDYTTNPLNKTTTGATSYKIFRKVI